jgi:hypothetical protein
MFSTTEKTLGELMSGQPLEVRPVVLSPTSAFISTLPGEVDDGQFGLAGGMYDGGNDVIAR